MDAESRATDFLAKMYCEKYGIEYDSTGEDLFYLFQIGEFRSFHDRYYRLVLGACV